MVHAELDAYIQKNIVATITVIRLEKLNLMAPILPNCFRKESVTSHLIYI